MDCDHTGPSVIEVEGEPPHDGMYDSGVDMKITYTFRNPDWKLVWAQPGVPSTELDAKYGAVYHGDKGRLTVTLGDGQGTNTDEKAKQYAASCDGAKIFRSPGHGENFEDCIRTREKPVMHMEAGHRVASLCILGNIAFQLQRRVEWDPLKEQFINDAEANRLLSRPGRAEWHL
jgi:hypothetical protein